MKYDSFSWYDIFSAALVLLILVVPSVFIAWMLIPHVSAIEINPSVDNRPFLCKYSFSKWICDMQKPGATGAMGQQGEMNQTFNLTPNMTAGPQGLPGTGINNLTAGLNMSAIVILGDNNGQTNLSIRNASNGQVAYIDSLGNVRMNHTSIGRNGLYGSTVSLDTTGVGYMENWTIPDNLERFGAYFAPTWQKTTAPFTLTNIGLLGRSLVGAGNTQDFTYKYGIVGTEGAVSTTLGSTGTITGAAALLSRGDYDGGAVITNHYGLLVENPAVTGRRPNNTYGIYIENMYSGITKNYSIYSVSGNNYFGGGYSTNTNVFGGTVNITSSLGIGANPPTARKLDVVRDDATTNTILMTQLIGRTTSGTAANGIGTELDLQVEDNAGTLREAGSIRGVLSDVTAANPIGYLGLSGRGAAYGAEHLIINSSGALRARFYTAGSLNTDANGNFYIISDPQYKTGIKPYTVGLKELLSLPSSAIITYKFKPESGLDTVNEYSGVDAAQLRTAIPEAVYEKGKITYEQVLKTPEVKDEKTGITTEAEYEQIEKPVLDKDGKQVTELSVSNMPIIMAEVNAIKELNAKIEAQNATIGKMELRIAALEKKVGL